MSTPTVESILDKHYEAMGGRARLDNIKAIRFDGILTEDGHDLEFSVLKLRPNCIKVVVEDGNFSEGFDGETAWEMRDDGIPRLVTGPRRLALERSVEWPSMIRSFDEFRAMGNLMVYSGSDLIDGREYHILQLALKDGLKRHYYFDAESYLLVRQRDVRPIHPDEDPLTIEALSEEFRKVEGVPISFKSREYVVETGEVLIKIRWEDITLNPAVTKDDFQIPPQPQPKTEEAEAD